MARLSVRCAVLLAVGVLAACGSPSEPVAEGEWGSELASLTLTRAGGTLGYQCGEGTMDSTWTMSADGRLVGTGVHYFGGGPVPVAGRTANVAQYSGVVAGRVLTLTAFLPGRGVTLGPFRMVRGDTGRVGPVCL